MHLRLLLVAAIPLLSHPQKRQFLILPIQEEEDEGEEFDFEPREAIIRRPCNDDCIPSSETEETTNTIWQRLFGNITNTLFSGNGK